MPEIITLSGLATTIPGTKSGAKGYLSGTSWGSAWNALSSSDQKVALVRAANVFERQEYCGTPTQPVDKTDPNNQPADTQPLQFPRVGLFDRNAVPVPDDAIPQDYIDANYELAAELGTTTTSTSETSQTVGDTGVKRTRAVRGVDVLKREDEIEYFASAVGANAPGGLADRFALPIMELIGRWICGVGGGSTTVLAPEIGSCDESEFLDHDYGFTGSGLP